uniref:Ubs_11 putative toxin n=1 Tax=Unedogemmula bisaya TaxID=746885 RepID=A0A098LY04_UNEBI
MATTGRWWSALLMVALGLLLQVLVAHSYEQTCNSETREEGPHPQGICGSNLSEILWVLCSDGHNSGRRSNRKRAADPESDDTAGKGRLRGLLLSKRQALSYLKKQKTSKEGIGYDRKLQKRQQSQGIVCECCYHHCSYNELIEYCN